MADAQDGNRRTDHANVVERIKTIAGGDPISINCKNKKQKLGVVLAAKIVIVANQHPKFLDESGALGERENVILFERYFKREERDLQLTAKLKRELPGIANWAIEGLRRLRANGEFSIVGRAAKTKADLTRQQATALRFGEECLTITGNKADMVPLKLAYDAYRLWAAEEGLAKSKIRDKTAFQDDMIAALRKHGVGFAEKQTRWHDPHLPHDGEGTRIKHRFIGVKLNRAAHPDYAGDEPDAYADFDFG
jgi:phage/plasmid-associated DNA primase